MGQFSQLSTLKKRKKKHPDLYGSINYTQLSKNLKLAPGHVFAVGLPPLKHEAVLAAEVHPGLGRLQLPLPSQGVHPGQEAVLPGVTAPGSTNVNHQLFGGIPYLPL